MKTKYYIKLLAPICVFGFIFRILEIMFAIEPDTGFFISESVIPILFNVYIILAMLFFLSVIFFTKKETKTVKGRFTKFSSLVNVFTLITAVFMLTDSIQTIITKYFIEGSFTNYKALLTDINSYTVITAIFAAFFLVDFATSPKRVIKSKFSIIMSLWLPIYYVLRLFTEFTDTSKILSHSYGTYTIIFLSCLTLAFINLSKVLAGSLCRKYLMAFSLCSVFMGVIHFAEFVLYFVPGNPYNLSINIWVYLADISICILLVAIFTKMSKKQKTKVKENEDEESKPELTEDNTEEVKPEETKTEKENTKAPKKEAATEDSHKKDSKTEKTEEQQEEIPEYHGKRMKKEPVEEDKTSEKE